MNKGTFIVARFESPEHLLPATAVLAKVPSVVRWDAVEGHAHLVVRLGGQGAPGEITSLNGLAELRQYEILHGGGAVSFDPALVYAYVFLETDPPRRAELAKTLEGMDAVASLARLSGGCDMMAVVRGPSFDAVDRIVNEMIRPLRGVLRLKTERIIDLQKL